jgi:hypothetical protein
MTRLLALTLVSLFSLSVVSTVAMASCGAKHCKAGDTKCENSHKGNSTQRGA